MSTEDRMNGHDTALWADQSSTEGRVRKKDKRVTETRGKRRSRSLVHVLSAQQISATGCALIPVDGYILPTTYSLRCLVRAPKHPLQIRARGVIANSSLLD